jgi:hypothetical protein
MAIRMSCEIDSGGTGLRDRAAGRLTVESSDSLQGLVRVDILNFLNFLDICSVGQETVTLNVKHWIKLSRNLTETGPVSQNSALDLPNIATRLSGANAPIASILKRSLQEPPRRPRRPRCEPNGRLRESPRLGFGGFRSAYADRHLS